MSIVAETLLTYLPSKRKTTPSGWTSFDAPCCIHNGESQDTRQRGGIKEEADTISYHCFNCGFKASWKPGRNLSYKMKQLFCWLGVPDDIVNKLALNVLRINEGVEAREHQLMLPEFQSVQLPEDSIKLTDINEFNNHN